MTVKPFKFQTRSEGNARPWNAWETGKDMNDQHYLLLHHKDMYVEDIAIALHRTVGAVKSKASLMGCSIKSKPKVSKDNE